MGLQQTIDDFRESIGGFIGQEALDFFRAWRESRQVEGRAAYELPLGCFPDGIEVVSLHRRKGKVVDR